MGRPGSAFLLNVREPSAHFQTRMRLASLFVPSTTTRTSRSASPATSSISSPRTSLRELRHRSPQLWRRLLSTPMKSTQFSLSAAPRASRKSASGWKNTSESHLIPLSILTKWSPMVQLLWLALWLAIASRPKHPSNLSNPPSRMGKVHRSTQCLQT